MTDIEVIVDELHREGVDIFDLEFKEIKAASLCDATGERSIGLDYDRIGNAEEHKTVLLHEQGHCESLVQ
jgi:hypothetical protein